MPVELTLRIEAPATGSAVKPTPDGEGPATAPPAIAGGPLSAVERAAFFAALRRKAELRLAALE